MARYTRREDLVTTTVSFKMFNKRYCDLTKEERKEYFRERKRVSRLKSQPKEQKDYLRGYQYGTQNK